MSYWWKGSAFIKSKMNWRLEDVESFRNDGRRKFSSQERKELDLLIRFKKEKRSAEQARETWITFRKDYLQLEPVGVVRKHREKLVDILLKHGVCDARRLLDEYIGSRTREAKKYGASSWSCSHLMSKDEAITIKPYDENGEPLVGEEPRLLTSCKSGLEKPDNWEEIVSKVKEEMKRPGGKAKLAALEEELESENEYWYL